MTTRRDLLITAAILVGGAGISARAGNSLATAAAVEDAIRKLTGSALLRSGRVRLEVPPLIENGNSVAITVSVESSMTAAEHVKAIHVFAPENPLPNIVSVYLGPRAGQARFTARVRVANSQTLLAIAQLSDGSFWSDGAEVIVTLPACGEER